MVAGTAGSRLRGSAAALALGALAAAAPSCIARTDMVPAAFNGGALDSKGDPFRKPEDVRADIVERIIWDEVIDAYFGQGPAGGTGPDGSGYRVDAWLRKVAEQPQRFVEIASCAAYGAGPRCKLRSTTPEEQRRENQAKIRRLTLDCAGEVNQPICQDFGKPSWPVLERVLDQVRFSEAITRAARGVAEVLDEGLVDEEAIRTGAARAFDRAASYIGGRRWRRERTELTTGLVVKGGAATGIFSAGAVWAVLHMMHGCMSDPACGKGRDLRFKLLSGTSTGAMITTAVDRWNSARTSEERAKGLGDLAKWFTCYSLTDLFCVHSAPLTRLFDVGAEAQRGVLEFDGIRKILTSCVNEGMRQNRSELVLNTVDFRTGSLFGLSDQAELRSPSCVVEAALASSLLPVIAQPALRVPVGVPYDHKRPDETEPSFLDGGIRSEIPLMPLARRGAERVLVVSSSNSVLSGTMRMRNALEIAQRYIDVSVGGVTESELVLAKRHAEAVRQGEIEACYDRLKEGDTLCPKGSSCDLKKICETREWEAGCSHPRGLRPQGLDATPPAPPAEAAPSEAGEPRSVDAPRAPSRSRGIEESGLAPIVDPYWRVMGIFRNESMIDGLNGYDFDPAELRRLFRAGAEQTRLHCFDVARLVGIYPPGPPQPELEKKLLAWCSPALPAHQALCGEVAHVEGFRKCSEDPPAELDACGPPPPAQQEEPSCRP